jgi:hypothetical protein
MSQETAEVLFETVEDTISTLETTLHELQTVSEERDRLAEENKKYASELEQKDVYLKKVASAPQFDVITLASVIKRAEKAGFVKSGSAKDAVEDIMKDPASLLFLVGAMADALADDNFSEGSLVKSASFEETAPVPTGKEGTDYLVDRDGWSRLIALAQKKG